jgi:hypothetical protein
VQKLVDDVFERLELAVRQRPKHVELLRLDVLPHGVLEQPRLVRRQLDAYKRSPQFGNHSRVHGAFLPGPKREKRLYA